MFGDFSKFKPYYLWKMHGYPQFSLIYGYQEHLLHTVISAFSGQF